MASNKKVNKKNITNQRVYSTRVINIVNNSMPEPLSLEGKHPIIADHTSHVVQLVEWGHTRLAADHLLFPELNGILMDVVGGIIRKLNLKFTMAKIAGNENDADIDEKIKLRHFIYDFLIETVLNLSGLESRELERVEKDRVQQAILCTLETFENLEKSEHGKAEIAKETVDKILKSMKLVQGGASMVAKSAERISSGISDSSPFIHNFIVAAIQEIESNIYHQMALFNRCKFGNDYALGLRWLRHLGYEQVSTNPVLAAKAYEDDPSLSEAFRRQVVSHPKYSLWASAPEKYADDITLYATLISLWDNLHVYRPVFYNLKNTTGGGVVSFQLNPNLAHLAGESIADALDAMQQAENNLRLYDVYLLAGFDRYPERVRPNIVIKVAASHPAARKIASTINSFGLGSNITVIYTVGQQVTMVLEEMAGMASAIRKGIMPTQVYMTNMGGRLESHLREALLSALFAKLKKELGEKKAAARVETLAKAIGALEKVKASANYEKKVETATAFRSGLKEIDGNVIEALKGVATKDELVQWEDDIAKSGTLVARRTWGIFFSEKNREKWINYISSNYDLEKNQAEFIMNRINYLPASKRKPLDTLWTLTANNMVHTEFGNHQENVYQVSLKAGFDSADYIESIRDSFDPGVAQRLGSLADWPVAYEINTEIAEIFKRVGIHGNFGNLGHTPEKWSEFGSVKKTSIEFKEAYDNFKKYIIGILPV